VYQVTSKDNKIPEDLR